MTSISRRSLAQGVAWTLPAVAIASAAPALAASCTPSTVTKAAAVSWVSTQTAFSAPTGDPEYHTVGYTFTNTGPDSIPAGTELNLHLTITVIQGDEANFAVSDSSSNVNATASNVVTDDSSAGTTTDTAVIKIVSNADIAMNDTFTLSVYATYGYVPSGTMDEETVTANSPITTTNDSTCTTTVLSLTVSGHSDGTSYTTNVSGGAGG